MRRTGIEPSSDANSSGDRSLMRSTSSIPPAGATASCCGLGRHVVQRGELDGLAQELGVAHPVRSTDAVATPVLGRPPVAPSFDEGEVLARDLAKRGPATRSSRAS